MPDMRQAAPSLFLIEVWISCGKLCRIPPVLPSVIPFSLSSLPLQAFPDILPSVGLLWQVFAQHFTPSYLPGQERLWLFLLFPFLVSLLFLLPLSSSRSPERRCRCRCTSLAALSDAAASPLALRTRISWIVSAIHIELLENPTIVWDFHSLLLVIQMMFSFTLTDEKFVRTGTHADLLNM